MLLSGLAVKMRLCSQLLCLTASHSLTELPHSREHNLAAGISQFSMFSIIEKLDLANKFNLQPADQGKSPLVSDIFE